MKIPVGLKVGALVVVTTAFYMYVGQLVPQKEVPAPEVIEMSKDMTTAQLVDLGQKIFEGKGTCWTCHKSGGTGRGPDLAGIGARAATEVAGLSALDYLAQSLYEPRAVLAPGYEPLMTAADDPPIGLNDDEIRAVIAYLQSLGGTPTVTMDTPIAYMGGAGPPGAGPGAEG